MSKLYVVGQILKKKKKFYFSLIFTVLFQLSLFLAPPPFTVKSQVMKNLYIKKKFLFLSLYSIFFKFSIVSVLIFLTPIPSLQATLGES